MFGRERFDDVIDAQLDLFVHEHRDVLEEARSGSRLYNAASRDEAEELYGDYVDAVETGTEILADMRDHLRARRSTRRTTYLREFNRAVAKRLAEFALEIENR